MLPTTSLDDSDVSSHDSYNCSSLSYDNGGFDSLQIGKAIFISSGKKMETNHDTPVPVPYRSKQSAVDIPLSEISSQHDWGSSRVIVHGSTLQNYVYPNPRLPSIDASQETEASKINLDRSTDNPRANYARSCLATPREMHMDTSISTDESELFWIPGDIDASPRIKASTESRIPTESKRNQRAASYMKRRYIVPKAPKKVRDEAQEALTAALDQVPATIHFDQRGKRTTACPRNWCRAEAAEPARPCWRWPAAAAAATGAATATALVSECRRRCRRRAESLHTSSDTAFALSSAVASASPSSQSPSLVPGQDGDGSFGELEVTRGPEPAEMKIGQEWMGHTKIKPYKLWWEESAPAAPPSLGMTLAMATSRSWMCLLLRERA